MIKNQLKKIKKFCSEDYVKETKVILFDISAFVFFGYVVYNLLAVLLAEDSKSAILYRINLDQCGIICLNIFMIFLITRAIKRRHKIK
jgi:hypothetical protein